MRPLENDEDRSAIANLLPLAIGAGDMRLQPALFAKGWIKMKWNGIGDRPFGTGRDQQPQRMGADQLVLRGKIVFPEMRRLVHRGPVTDGWCRPTAAAPAGTGAFIMT